jgi:hypothetical protein
MSISTDWDRSKNKRATRKRRSSALNQKPLTQAKSRRRGSVLVLMAVALMSMLIGVCVLCESDAVNDCANRDPFGM